MTRQRTYTLTVIAAVLYIFLCWAFADGLFTDNWWNSDSIASSPIVTYIMLALIVVAGIIQARRLPPGGVPLDSPPASAVRGQLDDPVFWRLLLGNTYTPSFGSRSASSLGGSGCPQARRSCGAMHG